MEEKKVMAGILVIVAVSIASYFVVTSGSQGAAIWDKDYLTCCCNIIQDKNAPTVFVRSQIETWEKSCGVACDLYYEGHIALAEKGACRQ